MTAAAASSGVPQSLRDTLLRLVAAGFAGGVEAASSTGGGILPPVMGTGAFIIAEFSGIPYRDIVLVSIVPALLYFAAVYYQVHLEALKHGIGGLRPQL